MNIFYGDKKVGDLFIKGKSSTFMHDEVWMQSGFSICPGMPLFQKEHYAPGLHGIFSDLAPDRWGRKLIKKDLQGRSVTHITEEHYLLGVSDNLRQGALRLSNDEGQTFLDKDDQVPPFSSLPTFTAMAEAIMRGEEHDFSELFSNVSLGGARAKFIVMDNGRQMLAKVPQFTDSDDVEGWEYVCLKLAEAIGIRTVPCSIHGDRQHHALLMDRFDRAGDDRIHYMSAMTLMGLKDGDESTYVDLAFTITSEIGEVDLTELYKRMLLNIMVSNVDDHLRNHGFLHENGEWRLSPVFDVTVSGASYGSDHALRINGTDPDTFETAINVASFFGLSEKQAKTILADIARKAGSWRSIAAQAGLSGIEGHAGHFFIEDALQFGVLGTQ